MLSKPTLNRVNLRTPEGSWIPKMVLGHGKQNVQFDPCSTCGKNKCSSVKSRLPCTEFCGCAKGLIGEDNDSEEDAQETEQMN